MTFDEWYERNGPRLSQEMFGRRRGAASAHELAALHKCSKLSWDLSRANMDTADADDVFTEEDTRAQRICVCTILAAELAKGTDRQEALTAAQQAVTTVWNS